MNLNAIVAPAVGLINPRQPVTVYLSTGPTTTAADGSRAGTYADSFNATMQVQPISTGDLRKLEGLNLQGKFTKLYLDGALRGLERVNGLGGDLVVLKDGTTYLVKAVLEGWTPTAGWCSVAVVMQNDAIMPYQDVPRF
jgi:hypothetical protein